MPLTKLALLYWRLVVVLGSSRFFEHGRHVEIWFRSEIDFLARLRVHGTEDKPFLEVVNIDHGVLQLFVHVQGVLELLLLLHDELFFGVVLCLAFGSLLGCELLEDAILLIAAILVPRDGPSSLVCIFRTSEFFDEILFVRRWDNRVLIIRLRVFVFLVSPTMSRNLHSCLVNVYRLGIDVSSRVVSLGFVQFLFAWGIKVLL